MKAFRSVLVPTAACVLVVMQAQADPTEAPGGAPATNSDTSGWELPKLPHFRPESGRDWFPDAARRMGLEGRVLVGFDISAQGRAKNVAVIWSEDRVFVPSAVEMVKGMRFDVPSDWTNEGAFRRWRLGIVYRLHPSCHSGEFAIPVETVVITGSRLVGAPVHPGACAPSSPH